MGLHVVVPGHGEPNRLPSLVTSVNIIVRTTPWNITCTVFTYNDYLLQPAHHKKRQMLLRHCGIVRKDNMLWTHFMSMVHNDQRDHVVLLLDDVKLANVNVRQLLDDMETFKYDVVAPSVLNWIHPIMRPKYSHTIGEKPVYLNGAGCLYRETPYTDMLLTIFNPDAWRCWRRHLMPYNNPHGWGHDVLFSTLCNVRIAISDSMFILHPKKKFQVRSYSETHASARMKRYLKIMATNETFRHKVLRSNTTCVRRS